MTTLYFDSLDAIKTALASPPGQAVAGNLANFANGAQSFPFFVTKDV